MVQWSTALPISGFEVQLPGGGGAGGGMEIVFVHIPPFKVAHSSVTVNLSVSSVIKVYS